MTRLKCFQCHSVFRSCQKKMKIAKVMLLSSLDLSILWTRLPKLNVNSVHEIRFEGVKYDHFASFETLGHTFATFLQPKLSAWRSAHKEEKTQIRRRICIFSSFCAELHADNLRWRNVTKVWPKVSNDVKWSYLTTSNLISRTKSTPSFGNHVHLSALPFTIGKKYDDENMVAKCLRSD